MKIPDVKLMEQFLGELMKAGNSKHARNVFRIGVSQGTWRLSQRREKVRHQIDFLSADWASRLNSHDKR